MAYRGMPPLQNFLDQGSERHQKFPGFEGAFVALQAPEGTMLYAFDEDFLGDLIEVEESDDLSEFPQ